jgi:hypothetical protein
MEDIRNYRIEEDEEETTPQDREREWTASPADDEVPFHIPRD